MPNSLLDEALELNVNTYVVKLVHLNHPRTDHRKGEMGFILIEGIDENELPISFCVGFRRPRAIAEISPQNYRSIFAAMKTNKYQIDNTLEEANLSDIVMHEVRPSC